MNYCTKCLSYYQVAGTCNCFAPGVIRTVPVIGYPVYPNAIPAAPAYPFPTWTVNAAAAQDIVPLVVEKFINTAVTHPGSFSIDINPAVGASPVKDFAQFPKLCPGMKTRSIENPVPPDVCVL